MLAHDTARGASQHNEFDDVPRKRDNRPADVSLRVFLFAGTIKTNGRVSFAFSRPRRTVAGNIRIVLLLAAILVTAALFPEGRGQAETTPDQVRLDSHGDPLPPGASSRLGTVRFRATGE